MQQTQALLLKPQYKNAVSIWLILCLALIACMVLLGGYTRLSGSGLSITEWKPIHGSIPPLNAEEWQEEFLKYQQIPQYQQVNKGMDLEEFKTIFWPEFWHRNLGRLIGIVFILPLLFFYFRNIISRPFAYRLGGIFLLGGLQGLMGWIMVASGLKDLLFVSHVKLAMHLGLAFILFGLILWALLRVLSANSKNGVAIARTPAYVKYFAGFVGLLFIQILFGAFMAGLHAGMIYNTFPKMDGYWLHPDVWNFSGIWLENIALIQFLHRSLAVSLVIYAIIWFVRYRSEERIIHCKKWIISFFALLSVQCILGILTLIKVVPLQLALKHQFTGLLLFAVSVILLYKISHSKEHHEIRADAALYEKEL